MQKRYGFGIVNLAILVFALILWVVDVAAEIAGLNFAWIAFIATAAWSVSFFARIFFEKQIELKKSWAILAGVFLVTAAGCLIGALALKGKLVLPSICLAAAVAALFGSVALGGKKWDEGDNQKPEYKNYYERKAEAEAQKKAEQSENEE